MQSAKGLRFALSACGFGRLLLLDEVVPLTADTLCTQNTAHVTLGVLHRPLGYSGFGCGFYNVLAGKLLPVCKQVKYQPFSLFGFGVIAADCTAFSCAQFHSRYLAGRIAMIGCPKLDAVDYSEKLTELFRRNDIRSVLVVRMQVPCCGGLTHAVETALAASGRDIPLRVVILTPSGEEVA